MGANLPRISEQWVYGGELPQGRVQLDSVAWFGWLAAETTRRFSYPLFDPQVGYIVGFMTVRKERRQRGGGYWVAYRRVGGQLHKVYIGSSGGVTAQRLEAIAYRLGGKEVVRTGKSGNSL
jgi:LuxR family maltose regulon positive regulatory protein